MALVGHRKLLNSFIRDPIHHAVGRSDCAAVKAFLDHGVDVNLPTADESKQTPLIIAGRCSSTKMIRLLLEYKANIDDTDNLRRTPFMLLKQNDLTGQTYTSAQVLLRAGADPLASSGYSIEFLAHRFGEDAICDLLIECGCKITDSRNLHNFLDHASRCNMHALTLQIVERMRKLESVDDF
jgi:ankyrin repeat protein